MMPLEKARMKTKEKKKKRTTTKTSQTRANDWGWCPRSLEAFEVCQLAQRRVAAPSA
jgi:hypothetical protein